MADEAATAGKAAESLYVQLVGDGRSYGNMLKGAVSQTEQASKAIAEETKKITAAVKNDVAEDSAILQHMTDSRLAKIGQRAVGSGLIIVGLVKRMIGAFQSYEEAAIHAFKETETAEMRLSAALEVHGGNVEQVMEQYKEFADQMQRVSTMSGTAAKQMLGAAEKYGMTGGKAMQAVQDAQALASRTGGEAGSFIRSIAMLQEGQISREFMRLIPALKKTKSEAEKFRLVNDYIAASYKFMNRELNTAAGHWRQLKNEISDVMEVFGKQIIQALRPLVDFGIAAAKWFKSLNPELQKTLSKITQIASLVVVGATAWGIWGAALKDVAILAFNVLTSFLSWPVVLVAGLGFVIYKTAILKTTWEGVVDGIKSAYAWVVDYLTPAIEGITDALKAGDLEMVWKIFAAQFVASLTDVWNLFKANWAAIAAWFIDLGVNTLDNLGEIFSRLWKESAKQAAWFFQTLAVLAGLWGPYIGQQIRNGILGIEQDPVRSQRMMDKMLGKSANYLTKAFAKRPGFNPFEGFEWKKTPFPELETNISKFSNTARDELDKLLGENEQRRHDERWWAFMGDTEEWHKYLEDEFGIFVDQAMDAGKYGGNALSNEFAKALKFDAAEAGTAEAMARIREFMDTGGIGGEGGGGKGKFGAIGVGGGSAEGNWDLNNGPDLGDIVKNTGKSEDWLEKIAGYTSRPPVVFEGAALT